MLYAAERLENMVAKYQNKHTTLNIYFLPAVV